MSVGTKFDVKVTTLHNEDKQGINQQTKEIYFICSKPAAFKCWYSNKI